MPVVHVYPFRQFGRALVRCLVGSGIGALPHSGLNETFGFSVGFWRVRSGSHMAEVEVFAGFREFLRPVARAVVCHDGSDGDAQAPVPANRLFEMLNSARLLFILMDLGEREAGMVIDGDVDIFPTIASAFAAAGIPLGKKSTPSELLKPIIKLPI